MTCIESFFETELLAESITLTANEYFPVFSGVPEIIPVLDPSDNPGGSEPAAMNEL